MWPVGKVTVSVGPVRDVHDVVIRRGTVLGNPFVMRDASERDAVREIGRAHV